MRTTCFLLLGIILPATGLAGIENDYWLSSISLAYSGPDAVTLCLMPDGSGRPLTQASLIDRTETDATITLVLRDHDGLPIANFPAEDLWLASADPGFSVCPGGTRADSPTNADGVTTWSGSLRAGGASQTPCRIMINGAPLVSAPDLAVHFNSPDLDGDLIVNLADVALFATDFLGGVYRFRSDLHFDGVLNLPDIVVLSRALGATCP